MKQIARKLAWHSKNKRTLITKAYNRFATQKQDGFALVAATLIVAVMSVAAIPLLGLVGTSQENNIKLQVESFLSAEARENLELAVYLTKYAGGQPGYFSTTHNPDSVAIARACENRIRAADGNLLSSTQSLISLNNTVVSPVTRVNDRTSAAFVVDKGKPLTQSDDGDDRYHRYLIASCAIATGYGMALYTSELANIQGSFYTLTLNEY